MIGKLLGVWMGEKIARRSVPTLAALALGGWAYGKWRERRRARPSFPLEATPPIPASETRSPS